MRPLCLEPAVIAAVSVAEAKDFLRLDTTVDDALLAGLVRTATTLCEQFTGRTLLPSSWRQTQRAGEAMVLARHPLVSLLAGRAWNGLADLGGLTVAELVSRPSGHDGWQIDAPSLPAGATHYSIDYRAGEATVWNDIDEPLRQGILRLVAHLYTHRDHAEDGAPPAAVTALWRPFRTMRVG